MANLSEATREHLILWFRHDARHMLGRLWQVAEMLHGGYRANLSPRLRDEVHQLKRTTIELDFFFNLFCSSFDNQKLVAAHFSSDLLSPVLDHMHKINIHIAQSVRSTPPILVRPELAQLAFARLFAWRTHENMIRVEATVIDKSCQFRLNDSYSYPGLHAVYSELFVAAGFTAARMNPGICLLTADLTAEANE